MEAEVNIQNDDVSVFLWPWLWLRRVVNIAAELFLRRSRARGGVKVADGLLLRR